MQNLDAMTVDELVDAAEAFENLATYANYKRRAVLCRYTGNVAKALDHEEACDRIYKTLPDWARW